MGAFSVTIFVMAYDDNAKRLAVQVIGTVESGLDYGAINYGDPITVGIMQWYGVRAAAILRRTIDENIISWVGVDDGADSIAADLVDVPIDDPWWNGRRLTQAEGESLRPVLQANRAIQDNQAIADMDVYRDVAADNGIDPDANTNAMIFFFAMYHQGPVYAFQVLSAVGGAASLEAFRDGALANPVLGQYANRYNEAYDLIKAGPVVDGGDGGGGDTPAPKPEAPAVGIKHVSVLSQSSLAVKLTDGRTVTCYTTTTGMFLPREQPKPAPVEPEPAPEPGTPPVTPTGKWVHPLPQGSVSSGYGDRGGVLHAGADISSVGGTGPGGTIVALTDMKITVAVEAGTGGLADAGTYVKGHSLSGAPYTFNHFHGHPGSLKVRAGQEVAAGTPLMTEGNSGNSFGSHLHLEIWEGHVGPGTVTGTNDGPWYWGDGTPGDPLPILRANGVDI